MSLLKKLILIMTFIQFMAHAAYAQDLILESNNNFNTPVIAGLELSNNQYKILATKILDVSKTVTDEFKLSDTLSLTFYILKYFSEIGEYEVEGEDIIKLVKGFLKLSKKSIPSEIWKIIQQMRKIKFGKKRGQHYVQIFSKKNEGIIYKINESLASEDDQQGTFVKNLIIQDKAELYFKDIKTPQQYLALSKYVRVNINALKIPMNWYKQLNVVNLDVQKNIVFYLNLDKNVNPLAIKMKGITISIITNSIFKRLDFNIEEAYALPGMTDGEEALPSTVFKAKTKLLNLKLTIDQ
ncbi:MAG: hypothetical protein HN576_13560 [Bacteriovoracaceae bacterium]|nr:hypothetical protein [Bacteriovoracaceae bacterium]